MINLFKKAASFDLVTSLLRQPLFSCMDIREWDSNPGGLTPSPDINRDIISITKNVAIVKRKTRSCHVSFARPHDNFEYGTAGKRSICAGNCVPM